MRGLIAILLRLYSGRDAEAIWGFDATAAFERLGLKSALSTQRSNGLFSMVERIRRDAQGARAKAWSLQAARIPLVTPSPWTPSTAS